MYVSIISGVLPASFDRESLSVGGDCCCVSRAACITMIAIIRPMVTKKKTFCRITRRSNQGENDEWSTGDEEQENRTQLDSPLTPEIVEGGKAKNSMGPRYLLGGKCRTHFGWCFP